MESLPRFSGGRAIRNDTVDHFREEPACREVVFPLFSQKSRIQLIHIIRVIISSFKKKKI
jgi:hypothetical protein